MKQPPHFPQLLLIFVLALSLVACNAVPSTSTPVDQAPLPATGLAPTSPAPAVMAPPSTLPPPLSPVLPTATHTKRPTITPAPTYTHPAEPTSLNPAATAAPLPEDNSFYQGLKEQGYTLFDSTSILGPQGYTYSAYLFSDPSFTMNEWQARVYRDWILAGETPGCLIAFYRWDGTQNVLLHAYTAPKYPEGSLEDDYPTSCSAHDWFDQNDWYNPPDDPGFFQDLGLENAWSDINQNGLPEFSVYYQYCDNGCRQDYGAPGLHFYEIQSTSKVVDITAGLPGVIHNFNFIYTWEPLVFQVYDPTKSYCFRCNIDSWWLYAWDGEKLANVSNQYPEFARQRGAEIAEHIREMQSGPQVAQWPVLEILFVYEKAGLGQEGLDLFLELTDPADWPNGDPCWLQIARAAAQEDFSNHRPFHVLDENVVVGLRYELEKIDRSKYDVSACDLAYP